MKFVLVLVAILACAYSLPVAEEQEDVPRTIIPEENDPLRQKYLVLQDEEGHYHIEDLTRHPGESRATIRDITLFLYTRTNLQNPHIIPIENFNAIQNSPFVASRSNFFIVHGWNGNRNSAVNTVIRNAVLSRYDVNVFVVDWSGPANLFYTSARNAVPAMGRFLGDFVNQMMATFNLSPAAFSLVGHSLGAHLIGIAGAQVNGLVSSLVGLDPAGPLYTIGNTDNRIDPSDGDYVQIIHTNGGLLGFGSSIGDADYFPNGGRSQPGCGLDLIGTCAHSRAVDLFAESVLSSNFFARSCGAHNDYTAGRCNANRRTFMGEFNIDRTARGDYHLVTNGANPFARG